MNHYEARDGIQYNVFHGDDPADFFIHGPPTDHFLYIVIDYRDGVPNQRCDYVISFQSIPLGGEPVRYGAFPDRPYEFMSPYHPRDPKGFWVLLWNVRDILIQLRQNVVQTLADSLGSDVIILTETRTRDLTLAESFMGSFGVDNGNMVRRRMSSGIPWGRVWLMFRSSFVVMGEVVCLYKGWFGFFYSSCTLPVFSIAMSPRPSSPSFMPLSPTDPECDEDVGNHGHFFLASLRCTLNVEVRVLPSTTMSSLYNYVLRVETFPVGGYVSGPRPFVVSPYFVSLPFPMLPVGTFGVLVWDISSSSLEVLANVVEKLLSAMLILLEARLQDSSIPGRVARRWVGLIPFEVGLIFYALPLYVFPVGSCGALFYIATLYSTCVVLDLFTLALIARTGCWPYHSRLYARVNRFTLALIARTGCWPCHFRLYARVNCENGRAAVGPATLGFTLALIARTGYCWPCHSRLYAFGDRCPKLIFIDKARFQSVSSSLYALSNPIWTFPIFHKFSFSRVCPSKRCFSKYKVSHV
ncbi:uncharacterized protein G2W53_021864 [Senna tora]|uniref:Uncharacterized protein n=1 Tax=Senna tora TaxID=362788 RepID=A0A834TN97_9FABA|nr:uncharacterized protein G2W53_021864 [Senna tora]